MIRRNTALAVITISIMVIILWGVKECWHLKDAKLVTRYAIGIHTPQDKKENFWKTKVLNCRTETGHTVFYVDLPDHLR